jgi:hypothetical protein
MMLCPETLAQTIVFAGLALFIGLLAFASFWMRVPFMAFMIGLGIISYSFAMFRCDTIIGFVTLMFGTGIMLSPLLRGSHD